MPIHNTKIAAVFDEIADFLEIGEEGVLIVINSDAHNIDALDHLQFGIGQARRGWLEKKDVLNTRPLKQLRKLLKQTM